MADPGHPGVAEDPPARRERLGEALAEAADAEPRVGEAVDEARDGAAVPARECVADRRQSESPSIRLATQPTLMRSQGRPQTFSLYSLK